FSPRIQAQTNPTFSKRPVGAAFLQENCFFFCGRDRGRFPQKSRAYFRYLFSSGKNFLPSHKRCGINLIATIRATRITYARDKNNLCVGRKSLILPEPGSDKNNVENS